MMSHPAIKTRATPPFSPKKTGYRDLPTTGSNVPPFLPPKPYFLTWATLPGEHRRYSPNIPPIFTGTIAHMQSHPRPDPQTPPPSTFCNVPQTTALLFTISTNRTPTTKKETSGKHQRFPLTTKLKALLLIWHNELIEARLFTRLRCNLHRDFTAIHYFTRRAIFHL